jgi:hypothetical protein
MTAPLGLCNNSSTLHRLPPEALQVAATCDAAMLKDICHQYVKMRDESGPTGARRAVLAARETNEGSPMA